jgi:FlaA1/EpsC-like NDP-sugar epimerase
MRNIPERVLITGAAGTIGTGLIEILKQYKYEEIICIDNNETETFFLQEKYKKYENIKPYLLDIRDEKELTRRMKGVNLVIHAAALKHVILSEESPNQAIRTNIEGTQNIIQAAIKNNVARVVFTSSDKAVNPTNVMGATKLLGERLMTAAAAMNENTIFSSTRFGNVLGSRGSVIPIFKNQIANGDEVTLTDERMTRFIMTADDACNLVIKSISDAENGDVVITKMPVAKIKDIAEIMIERSNRDIKIKEIGAKQGEKMYEELMTEEEVRRAAEYEDSYIVRPPGFTHIKRDKTRKKPGTKVDRPYNSSVEPAMTKLELEAYLQKKQII